MAGELEKYTGALSKFADQKFGCAAVPREISGLFPHLNDDELKSLIAEADEAERTYAITPPTKIRGAELVFSFSRKGNQLMCYGAGAHRRRESYYHTNPPKQYRARAYDYRDRVANYAETHWGEHLRWDKGHSHYEVKVVDPRKTDKFEQLAVVNSTVAILDTSVQTLRNTDKFHLYPTPQYIEQAISIVATNTYESSEMLGGCRPDHVDCFCSICGGGLGEKECAFCGTAVKPATQLHEAIGYPISLKVVTALQWDFEIPPTQAWRAYYGEWGNDGLTVAPKSKRKKQRERKIQLPA
jgi:hypothetical protein